VATNVNFALNQSFSDGKTVLPAGGPFTFPSGSTHVSSVVSTGNMPNANQYFRGRIQLNRNDGRGFVDVGGIEGPGGSFPPNKDGSGIPVPQKYSATVDLAVQQGWLLQCVVDVTSGPITASASGTVS
jgi:hypothetical protein